MAGRSTFSTNIRPNWINFPYKLTVYWDNVRKYGRLKGRVPFFAVKQRCQPSGQLFQESFGFLQIHRVEAFGEPIIDRC